MFETTPNVNMYYGILSDHIISPFIFEDMITSRVHLVMLVNFVFPQTAELKDLIFKQDCMTQHFASDIHRAFNIQFPDL